MDLDDKNYPNDKYSVPLVVTWLLGIVGVLISLAIYLADSKITALIVGLTSSIVILIVHVIANRLVKRVEKKKNTL